MCLLFETIKLSEGKFCNLCYHSERMNYARNILFKSNFYISPESILTVPAECKKGLFKCRVEYDYYIHKIEINPYIPKKIYTLKLVYDDGISYQFKYTDRTRLKELKKQENADDIIIVKNGMLTDTSFSNIIFYDGNKWITPAIPLLEGTKRRELLEKGVIQEKNIYPSDLKYFSKAKLINAMLDFDNSEEMEMENIFV